MIEIVDQIGRKLQFKRTPKRIVSLVPSQTELLVDLGLENSIVGVTKFCIHPDHIRKSKKVVGGTKQIHVNKIEALQPDIILCNKEENTKAMVASLEHIAPVHVSDIFNLDDAMELIRAYGELFNVVDKASTIINTIKTNKLLHQTNALTHKVAYFIWRDPWMVAARNTFIDAMLEEAGFINVFKKDQRYPEVTLDNETLLSADIILLSSEPYPFKEEHINELNAVLPNQHIKLVDGELFSWYGSRLIKSFEYFRALRKEFI